MKRLQKKTTQSPQDPYAHSAILRILTPHITHKRSLKIAFLDIDDTLTGDKDITDAVRAKLALLGYVVVFVTARTEEMILSSTAYKLSATFGFDRPRPKIHKSGTKYIQKAPELLFPRGLLDPEIVAGSSGTQILIRQPSGAYLLDYAHERTFGEPASAWREKATQLVQLIDPEQSFCSLADIEDPTNFHDGKVDVYPPKYRVAVNFSSSKERTRFQKAFRQMQLSTETQPATTNIRLTDDSHPAINHFAIELTPRSGGKRNAVNHIIQSIRDAVPASDVRFKLLIAGDKFQDLNMGLRAAPGSQVTFIIPGGATATNIILHETMQDFADQDADQMQEALKAYKPYGVARYVTDDNKRSLIIGDRAYKGKTAVETLLHFLQAQDPTSVH